MDESTNTFRTAFLAFATCVAIATLFALGSAKEPAAAAEQSKSLVAHTSKVTVWLRSNTFLSGLNESSAALLKPTKGTTAARAAAQRNPLHFSATERVAASIADASRNAALPAIRSAAKHDVDESHRVQRRIQSLHGSIESAIPIPNQIIATIPTRSLDQLRVEPGVLRIDTASSPIWMNQPIDGSPTWHLNGFTGQGTSLDGNSSPDFVSFDQGTRTTHDAFKTRMPGDCATCIGSGPSRIISPVVRTDFTGAKHGNVVAATVGATSFNAGMNPSSLVGMAYGIDKEYDNYEAYNPYLWDLGISTPRPVGYPNTDPATDPGLGANSDLPETINYSAGIYTDTQDVLPGTEHWDALESVFGILNTISAGNCGIATVSFDGCIDGPHRVSAPGTNYNVLTVGGLDTTTTYPDTSGYFPWANSSPGPTWGGRKKPDLVATVNPTAGTPSAISDTAWTSGGQGTSFAAPQGAAGALLLASTGVYDTKAQRAILINSTTPVLGQTYWTPRTGWGAMNLENAFPQRGNYALGSVTGSGTNGARFFKLTGVSAGDRATLVWDRRTDTSSILGPNYFNLTNLDLSQLDPGTLASTATGGSDAADAVDTDQVVTAANPMPSNGADGGDNVEQIRSTSTGTQILKVKSQSSIDGATTEPFSIAATNPVTALSTPIPDVTVQIAPTITGGNGSVQVTATVENPSDDLALDGVEATISLPPNTSLISDNTTVVLGTIPAGGFATKVWNVQNNLNPSGTKAISVSAEGTSLGEPFTGSGSSTFDVDATPPTITVTKPPAYSTTTTPLFQWAGNDSQSAVANYDVESSIDGAPFTPFLTATTQTSGTLPPAAEGQNIRIRVRGTDLFGNVSDWTEVSTTIDVVPPVASIGTIDKSQRGTLRVQLLFSNVGSPLTSTFSFANNVGGRTGSATSGQFVSYVNTSPKIVFATLRLVVKDALGREASLTETYAVESALSASGLKFSRVKKSGAGIAVAGKVAKAYTGKVRVTAKRVGSKGTKMVTRTVTAKNGKFSTRLAVKPGTYKVVASTSKTSKFTANTVTKKLSIK